MLTSITDRNGNAVTFTDGGANYATTLITDTYGVTATPSYSSSYLSGITLSTGRVYGYTTDATSHKLTKFAEPGGSCTSTPKVKCTVYTYNSTSGLLQYIDTQRNSTDTYRTGFQYDSIGRVTQVDRYTGTNETYPYPPTAAYSTTFTYTAPSGTNASPVCATGTGCSKVNLTNARSKLYVYESAADLRVVKTTDPIGNVTSQTWQPDGETSQFTSAVSAVSTLAYNSDNMLNSVTNPGTDASTTTSTAFSYPSGSVTDPLRYLPTYTTSAQTNRTDFTYDSKGNLTQSSTHNTPVESVVRVVKNGATTPCTSSPSSGTPKDGQLCRETDANGKMTLYNYTSGRLTTITHPTTSSHPSPIIGATTLAYDGDTRISTVTDGKSQVTRYTYDDRDRITQLLYNGATTCSSSAVCTTFAYDYAGNLKTRVDNSGTTTFTYDAMNLPTAKAIGGTTVATDGFDAVHNLITINSGARPCCRVRL